MITTWLRICLALLLCSCGSGGSPAPIPNSNSIVTVINGTANLGIVNGASVAAYQFINGAATQQLGTTQTTSATGNFSINIGTYTGLVMLILRNPNSTATYIDEAKGKNIPMGADSFRALLSAPLSAPISITPLTEISTEATVRKINAGAIDYFAMAESAVQVGAAFSNGAHPLYNIPMDLSARSVDTVENEAYASSLAGLAVVAAAANKAIFSITRTYTDILFPNGTATGSLSVLQLNELRSASANFNGNALVLNTPNTIALPTGTVNLGSTALNKNYLYLYQNKERYIANTPDDSLETGVLTVASPNSNLRPFELWTINPSLSAIQQTTPAIDNAASSIASNTGELAITTSRTQHMQMRTASQAGLLAGSFLKAGATQHEWSFAVQQHPSPLTPNLVAATYHFISMGKNNTGHFTQDGSLTLNADFSLTLTTNRTDAGSATPIRQTQNFVYSILPGDNRIRIALPDGTQINMMLATGQQYGIFSELNASTGQYSSGFIIRQHNNTPYIAGRNYHYLAMSALGTQFSSESGLVFVDGLQQLTGKGTQLITNAGSFISLNPTTLTGILATLKAGQTTLKLNQKTFTAFYSQNAELLIAHDPGVAQLILIRQ